jgi:hypothetical protein
MCLAALDKLAAARRLTEEADTVMVFADLCALEPEARRKRDAATAARQACEPVVEKGNAVLAALRRRQDALEERRQEAAAAADTTALSDEEFLSTDVDLEVDASARLAALEKKQAELRQRIALVSNALSPPMAALNTAKLDETIATGAYEALREAIADPLNHRLAEDTSAYRSRVTRNLGEILLLPGHPDTAAARGVLWDLLEFTGMGAEIQEQGIRAYVSNDPRARAVGGESVHMQGGKLIAPPDGPPLFIHGAASPGQLAAPGTPQTDTRSAAEVMAQTWASTAYTHQSQPGLPGISH